jgi:5'(3')-deoxyribonucleotidase
MRDLIVGVDIDDVVAELVPAWQARYNKRYNDSVTPQDWSIWDITTRVKPECGAKIYDILREPDLYNDVHPTDGALDGVNEIRAMGHRVLFITSCGYDEPTISASAGAKLKWLQRWGFLPTNRTAVADYVVASDKKMVKADLLIDDRATTIEAWGSQGIIFTRPHNAEYHHAAGLRVSRWDSIPGLVRQYQRYINA